MYRRAVPASNAVTSPRPAMQPPPSFGRGGVELPLPGPAQPRVAVAAGEPAQADPRHRLEGATVIAADLPGRWSSPGTQNTGILGRLPVGRPGPASLQNRPANSRFEGYRDRTIRLSREGSRDFRGGERAGGYQRGLQSAGRLARTSLTPATLPLAGKLTNASYLAWSARRCPVSIARYAPEGPRRFCVTLATTEASSGSSGPPWTIACCSTSV